MDTHDTKHSVREENRIDWRCPKDDRLLAEIVYADKRTHVQIKCRGCKHIEERTFKGAEENQIAE